MASRVPRDSRRYVVQAARKSKPAATRNSSGELGISCSAGGELAAERVDRHPECAGLVRAHDVQIDVLHPRQRARPLPLLDRCALPSSSKPWPSLTLIRKFLNIEPETIELSPTKCVDIPLQASHVPPAVDVRVYRQPACHGRVYLQPSDRRRVRRGRVDGLDQDQPVTSILPLRQ